MMSSQLGGFDGSPLLLGGEYGGELRDVEAFSGLGSYLTGATNILDTVGIKYRRAG